MAGAIGRKISVMMVVLIICGFLGQLTPTANANGEDKSRPRRVRTGNDNGSQAATDNTSDGAEPIEAASDE